MLRSESITQVAAALAAAQGSFPAIPKDRTVTVTPRKRKGDNGDWYQPPGYSFSYAPLDTILGCVRPHLSANGLALTQAVMADEKGHGFVRTTLLHASGEWLACDTQIFTGAADNASQAYASGLTYARRYGVTTLLCIAADDDDDANGTTDAEERTRATSGRTGGVRQPQAKPQPKPQAQPPADDGQVGLVGLSESQERLLLASAKRSGLERDQLLERFPRIDLGNLNTVLAKLREGEEATA